MRPEAFHEREHDQLVGLELTVLQFRKFLALRGDRPTPRVSYLEPSLELRSPSKSHEVVKVLLCRLLETWADERGVELFGMGSTTLRTPRMDRAIEPDGSYLVGTTSGSVPHLAVEVDWSHRSERNLAIYAALGVREVWTWREDVLTIHVLRRGRMVASTQSEALPELDVPELEQFLLRWRRPAGLLRAYRALLRRQ